MFLVAAVFVSLLLAGCGSDAQQQGEDTYENHKENHGEDTWENHRVIPEEIVKLAGEQDVYLGELAAHGVEVFVPAEAFEVPTEIHLSTPNEPVAVDKDTFIPASSLYALTFRGEQARTDVPVTVTLYMGKETLQAAEETGGFRALHFQEDLGWTYTRPVEVDVNEGLLVFETYHNFLWGGAALTEEERIDQQSLAISREQWARSQLGEDLEELTKEIVDEMVMEAFDGENHDIAAHVSSEVADQIARQLNAAVIAEDGKVTILPLGKGYGMTKQLIEGDYQGLGINIATESAKSLNKYIESKALSSEIKSALNYTGLVSNILGAVTEGNFVDASQHIAEFMISKNHLLQAAQLTVQSVDMKINNWRDKEIEKAYQVFVHGAQSSIPWWGYQVNKGDFDSLWMQMRGVARQVEIDALNRHARLWGMFVDEILPELAQKIRDQAAQDLREQFEKRRDQEASIAELKKRNDYIIERFESWGLLQRGVAFPADMPIEEQLGNLFGQLFRVVEDTGRSNIIYDVGHFSMLEEDEVTLEQIMQAVHVYNIDGEEGYLEKLLELGLVTEEEAKSLQARERNGDEDEEEGLEIVPDLTGQWKGTMTILRHDIEVPELNEGDGFEARLGQAIAIMLKQSFDILVGESLELNLHFARAGEDLYEATAEGMIPQRVVETVERETEGSIDQKLDFQPFQAMVEGKRITFDIPDAESMPNSFTGHAEDHDTIGGTFKMVADTGAILGSGVWECRRQ